MGVWSTPFLTVLMVDDVYKKSTEELGQVEHSLACQQSDMY